MLEPRADWPSSLRASTSAERPIALVNLLRFAATVAVDGATMSGEAAYDEYVRRVEGAVFRHGGRPVFRARGSVPIVGQADERWDLVVVVWYPSRSAFEGFMESADYRSNAHLAQIALAEATVHAVTAPQRVGRLAGALYALTVRLRRHT